MSEREKDVERLEVYGRGFTGYVPPRGMYGAARLSGYDTDPDKIAAKFCVEGCLVLDKRPCDHHEEYVELVLSGPMPDPFGKGDVCPEPSPALVAGVAGNAYGTLLGMHAMQKAKEPNKPGSLDSIPWADYCAMWKRIGARTGVVRDGIVVWDE